MSCKTVRFYSVKPSHNVRKLVAKHMNVVAKLRKLTVNEIKLVAKGIKYLAKQRKLTVKHPQPIVKRIKGLAYQIKPVANAGKFIALRSKLAGSVLFSTANNL
ncbi:MAG: hypothetical protein ABI855_19345 [Bacteroidota bacterium]